MRVINNVARPGEIKKVELDPNFVRIELADNREILYRLDSSKVCGGTLNEKAKAVP